MKTILQQFNPKDQAHVQWLEKMSQSAKTMKNLESVLKENPMKATQLSALDAAELHLLLATKYTDAIFEGVAWIPPQKNTT